MLCDVNESGVVAGARLKRAVGRKLETISDIHQQLQLSVARLLRYLCAFLTADPVIGIALCGAIGASRSHQLVAFASIYRVFKKNRHFSNGIYFC